MSRTSNNMLHKSGKNEHSCLVPDLRGNAISFSLLSVKLTVSLPCMLVAQSCLILCDPTAIIRKATLSMIFHKQEYWSGLPFPSPEHIPNPGIKPTSPTLSADWQILYCLRHQRARTWPLLCWGIFPLCLLSGELSQMDVAFIKMIIWLSLRWLYEMICSKSPT